MSEPLHGGCLCGAVRFDVTVPVKWVANCHCSMCRRAHGAPYVTWVSVPTSQFNVTHGFEQLANYQSSADASRSFCSKCGSMMLFRSKRWADEIHIARANIEGDALPQPMVHAFFSDRASWVHISDELPKRGGVTGTEPL